MTRLVGIWLLLGKSLADDGDLERGIVRSRVANLLRSSEVQPLVLRDFACGGMMGNVGE